VNKLKDFIEIIIWLVKRKRENQKEEGVHQKRKRNQKIEKENK